MPATPRTLSIRYRVPLLICALLFSFAAALGWAAYVEVKKSDIAVARGRLNDVARQMAGILEASAANMGGDVHRLGLRPQVVEYLRSNSPAVATTQSYLDSLAKQSAAVVGLEVWGVDAQPLLAASGGVTTSNPEAAQHLVSQITEADTSVVGSHRQLVDSSGTTRVYHPIVAPVREAGRLLGYFVVHRRLTSTPEEIRRIRDLIGSDVGLYVGSPETQIWTDFTTVAPPPPTAIARGDSLMTYRRPDSGWQFAATEPVQGTPWLALLEFPSAPILEGSRTFLMNFSFIGGLLLLLGGLGAYALSRDITRPIAALAAETKSIAAGDFRRRVDVRRGDELGALGRAFNTMAQSVGDSVEHMAADIAERKRAEEALRAADETIRAMLEASPLPILSLNTEARVKLWNKAAEDVLGWSAAEAMGKTLPYITPELATEHNELFRRALGGEVFMGHEVRRVRRDGTPLFLRLSCGATYDSSGNATGVTVIYEDITHRRRLEDQFRQAQKMEAVGRLAGGIAHDFNNLLTVVLGASDLLLHEIPEHDEHSGIVREIRQAGERAAALTTQLLAFSRKQLVEPKVFVPNSLVLETDKMLRRLIGEDIQISMRFEQELGAIEADRGHVEQVLVNLVVNARDAMPTGGLLVIQTANVVLDENYLRDHAGVRAGEYVMLSVSDSGSGMSDETKAHLFEPFFTTKAAGKGTGLGLATCYGIVRQAGGHIGVYSEPGVGTTMKVYFPRVAGTGTEEVPAQEPLAHGNETLLLVEDDKAVRAITRRMLDAQGYNVLEAEDGPSALEILERHDGRLDLLLTDVVLPGMGGREVAERARAILPDIKVLFTSGYTDDIILQHKLLEHDVALLQKPFTPRMLAQKIRSVLDGTGV